MPTNLTDFFNLLATPTFAAVVVLWLMQQVVSLAALAPGPKRLVGLALCLGVSGLATAGLFFVKVITVIDANVIFQVFMEAFLIAQSLQLLTAPAAVAPVIPVTNMTPSRSVPVAPGAPKLTMKFSGFGWW